ncbi:prion-like-(Q/N-rich) domain-bearing protein 25 isoform X2 [Littorina saxatilis]|uniref:prion-like-(Q/N-rich) domain-bearing protein 25 isoform X2 n=1 Tax=Littorina saxatilis TaxID=31220 RepID=UPI0038B50282
MKTWVILTIACVAYLPGELVALITCPAMGQCPANANCPADRTPCLCNAGFHENTAGNSCEQDIVPGFPCVQQDSDRECVDGASCTNVTPEGAPLTLQCMCKDSYIQRANVGGVPTCKRAPGTNCTVENGTEECVPESTCTNDSKSLAGQVQVQLTCSCNPGKHLVQIGALVLCKEDVQPGGNCTMAGEDTECVDNSSCTQDTGNATQCTCNARFHAKTDSATNTVACHPDVAPNSTCGTTEECVDNAACHNITQRCVCVPGFHLVSMEGTPYSCQADTHPGGTCSMADDASKCVENASCVNVTSEAGDVTSGSGNVTSEGGNMTSGSGNVTSGSGNVTSEGGNMTSAGGMQCECNVGYHVMADSALGTSSCQLDVIVGGACTMNGSDAECVEDATCMLAMTSEGIITGLECSCMEGYHRMIGNPACEKDKAPGTTCLIKSSAECVQNAVCQSVTPDGQPEDLKCVCVNAHHVMDNATCQRDFDAGQQCSQENSTEQCVDHATCTAMQSGGGTFLRCTCDTDYHETHDDSNRTVCAEDECQHTKVKCAAAGMTSCQEVNTFVGCMLTGKCDSTDSEQVAHFRSAMMDASARIPADCADAGNTTCTEKVTACLNAYLATNTTCNSVDELGTCLTSHQTECMEDAGHKLATEFMKFDYQLLSCVCVKASDQCLQSQTTNYNATDNATKCSAVKELFTCALDDVSCNVSKTTDHQKLSELFSTAMSWSSATGCKDTLQNAATCPLRLTHCGLVYADDIAAAADNKTMQCRTADAFGGCIEANKTMCTENDPATTLFTEQYTLVSSQCLCVSKVTQCQDAVGNVTADPVDVCPKLVTLGLCLLGAKCHMADANDNDDVTSLDGAHHWYTQHRDASSCYVTSNSMCSQDMSVCADTLINKLQGNIPATQKCSAISDSMLCFNAANCSSDVAMDVALMTSSQEAARYRLQSLACKEPECNVSHQGLTDCKTMYEASFTAAGTDNTRKCTAKNDMVRCLRKFDCNTRMKDVVQQKYDALEKVSVTGCKMLSLEEDGDDGTSTALCLNTSLLVLMLCLLASAASARAYKG